MPKASEYLTNNSSEAIDRAGIYRLTPTYVNEEGTTKKGDPLINICWEDKDGKVVWDHVAIVSGAAFRWAQMWFAFGEEDQDFPTVDDLAAACLQRLKNEQRVYASVKLEPYKGKKIEYKDTMVPSIDEMLKPEEGEAMAGHPINNTNEDVPF